MFLKIQLGGVRSNHGLKPNDFPEREPASNMEIKPLDNGMIMEDNETGMIIMLKYNDNCDNGITIDSL